MLICLLVKGDGNRLAPGKNHLKQQVQLVRGQSYGDQFSNHIQDTVVEPKVSFNKHKHDDDEYEF